MATAYFSTAVGYNAGATANYATGLGAQSNAGGLSSTAVGRLSSATGNDSVAIGAYASDNGLAQATALGDNSKVTQATGVALGQGSVANRAALGATPEFFTQTVTNSSNAAVSVGTVGGERQIINVAGGTAATDAVNVRQLQYVASNLATALGGGASFSTSTGAFAGPSYTVQGGTYTNVGSALGALDTAVTSNAGAASANATNLNTLGTTTAAAIGGGTTYAAATGLTGTAYLLNGSAATYTNVVAGEQAIASGAAGPLQYATPGTASNAVNLVGTGAPVTLGNVAPGTLAANSTQAVNGSQLFATNQVVANLQTATATGLSALDGRVGTLESQVGALTQYATQSRLQAQRGIAAVAAAAPVLMPSLPGRTTIAVKGADFHGQVGTGVTLAHRMDTNLPIVVFGSYSNGGGREHVVAGGAGLEF